MDENINLEIVNKNDDEDVTDLSVINWGDFEDEADYEAEKRSSFKKGAVCGGGVIAILGLLGGLAYKKHKEKKERKFNEAVNAKAIEAARAMRTAAKDPTVVESDFNEEEYVEDPAEEENGD